MIGPGNCGHPIPFSSDGLSCGHVTHLIEGGFSWEAFGKDFSLRLKKKCTYKKLFHSFLLSELVCEGVICGTTAASLQP